MSNAVTFTRDELISQIAPIAITLLEGDIRKWVMDEDETSSLRSKFEHLSRLPRKMDNELIEIWCDLVSISYFCNNKDVDEVLFLSETRKDGTKIKEWMASR